MSTYLQLITYVGLVIMLALATDRIMTHDTSTALRLCMVEHSHDTCFQALNR